MAIRTIVKRFQTVDLAPEGLIAYFTTSNSGVSENISPKTIPQYSSVKPIFGTIPGTSIPATKFLGTSTSYVYVNNTDKLQLTKTAGTSFTVEAWIYAEGIGQNPNGYGGEIVNKDAEFEFCRMGDGRIAVAVDWGIGTDTSLPGGGWLIPPAGTAVVPLNTATHVAIVVDNTTLQVVLNGSLAWTKTGLSRTARKDATAWFIGNRTAKNQGFNGYIGEVRVWDHARTVSEIYDSLYTTYQSFKSVYTVTMPFNGECVAYLWGGGGGGGSGDVNGRGGDGCEGLYATTTFSVSKGDTVEVTIGNGGSRGVSGRPQFGGSGGEGRTNIGGQAAKTFSGGTGGNGPVSGAGGGGGGATSLLVNGALVAVAGGGAGGGGAGNGNPGKAASISRNAMTTSGGITVTSSNLNATKDRTASKISVNGNDVVYGMSRGHTLAVFNPSTLALESTQNFDTYGTNNSTALVNALNAVANGKIVAIGSWDAIAIDQNLRNLLNSQFGGTETKTIKKGVTTPWEPRTSHIFISVKNGGITAIEKFSAASGSAGIISATYGTGTSVPTEYRGENGQTRASDGGTGGGGGGGYPGGDGGRSNPGDSGGDAGYAGGSFPVPTNLRGTNSPYYNSNYGDKGLGDRPDTAGSGKPGYAILVFTPEVEKAVVSAIKVSGIWRQVLTGHVKVSGAWRQIESAYVKVNGEWKQIRSSGDVTGLEFAGSTSNYGSSQRPYS